MKTGRLNLRIDKALLDDIRDYADRVNISLTEIVVANFRSLLVDDQVKQLEKREDTEQI